MLFDAVIGVRIRCPVDQTEFVQCHLLAGHGVDQILRRETQMGFLRGATLWRGRAVELRLEDEAPRAHLIRLRISLRFQFEVVNGFLEFGEVLFFVLVVGVDHLGCGGTG